MPVYTKCQRCHRPLSLPEKLIGRSIQCPLCSAIFHAQRNGVLTQPHLAADGKPATEQGQARVLPCAFCRRSLQVPPHLFGKSIQCPYCKRIFVAKQTAARMTSQRPAPPPTQLAGKKTTGFRCPLPALQTLDACSSPVAGATNQVSAVSSDFSCPCQEDAGSACHPSPNFDGDQTRRWTDDSPTSGYQPTSTNQNTASAGHRDWHVHYPLRPLPTAPATSPLCGGESCEMSIMHWLVRRPASRSWAGCQQHNGSSAFAAARSSSNGQSTSDTTSQSANYRQGAGIAESGSIAESTASQIAAAHTTGSTVCSAGTAESVCQTNGGKNPIERADLASRYRAAPFVFSLSAVQTRLATADHGSGPDDSLSQLQAFVSGQNSAACLDAIASHLRARSAESSCRKTGARCRTT
ncbi:MAG: hypothetical protein KatS3mg105_3433 [Gemmatales bacterium]|nr:MAG: hypothetical protein KatS3mg105_3433 [Gemmatales bacterium]